jgi:hypothetical protein
LNELQLVGYTADLQHLVLSDAAGASRFRVPVDDDFLATVEEVVGLATPEASFLQPTPESPPLPAVDVPEPPPPAGPPPGEGALAASGVIAQREVAGADAAEQQRGSSLSPREIQALLRAGKTPAAVAKLAGTSESLILRWLPPIEAERDQVLQGVWRQRVRKSRLGPSRDPLGEAVRRNLGAKGVRPEDEDVSWTVARRDGDDLWTVQLRYRSRGRVQRAVWRYDPETDALEFRNELAAQIAWTRPRRGREKAPGGPADSTASSESSESVEAPDPSTDGPGGASEAGNGRSSTKKATAKKSTARKKATAKKSTARKKATAKKAPAKKATAKRATTKKATAKRSTTRKKATAKKATAKKSAARKKATAKKVLIRRPRPADPPGPPPAGGR